MRATLALILAAAASPAAAHVGDHSHARAAHFVLEPAHLLPVLALAAVVAAALLWRRRRARIRES